jgi:hypothetical protein
VEPLEEFGKKKKKKIKPWQKDPPEKQKKIEFSGFFSSFFSLLATEKPSKTLLFLIF